jgi:hypothetical protein
MPQNKAAPNPSGTFATKCGYIPSWRARRTGLRIPGMHGNPVSLSGVKAGHLLSTVSQEVWLQGMAEVSHFVIMGDELQGGNDL